MRRLALWALAAFAFLRFLSWKRAKALPAVSPPAPEPEPAPDPRADELRAKLEARAVDEEPAPDPEPEAEPAVVPDPDERRRSVHERGRRAAEQMRDPGTSD